MRKIKFRVWNGEQMVSPDYVDRAGYAHWYEDGIPNRSNKLIQFTGLKDNMGNEIYEGDILEFDPDEWGSTKGNRWAVEWNDEDGSWSTGGGTNRECSIWKKVIGNVYEHPDLLK